MPFHKKNIRHRPSGQKPFNGASQQKFQGARPAAFSTKRNTKKMGFFSDVTKFVNKVDTFYGEEVYEPQHQFTDFNFHPNLQKNIAGRGYITPTPIQDQSIRFAMQNNDVLGLANTGTGKTAAFLLPLIDKIYKHRGERALIIAPTRELAVQINDELKLFTPGLNIYSAVCIGGASLHLQIQQLRKHPQFVIATPGRLKDLLQQRAINITQFHNVVLDEVDQMFDMGFIKDIQYLLSLMPDDRQSLFFSATLSKEIDALVKAEMRNPVVISLKKRDTAATVDQDIVRLKAGETKIDVLHDLLIKEGYTKVLIFGRTKRGVHKLARTLDERGFKVDAIHGDRSQNQRQSALTRFKNDQITILVATDVAARGIDIPDVSHVINYELPETYEDYVHRIGRTGRANKLGKALTFLD